MKIPTIFLTIIMTLMTLISCNDGTPDMWDSQMLAYSGRFICEGKEYQIYNTSANKEGEIIIYDIMHNIPLKSKFFITGDPQDFKSVDDAYDALPVNEFAITVPTDIVPTGVGESMTRSYPRVKAALSQGNILKDAYTTVGDNITDKIELNFKFYSGLVTFVSVEKDSTAWVDPNVAEYEWEEQGDPVLDNNGVIDELSLSGYRYTGFPEDD